MGSIRIHIPRTDIQGRSDDECFQHGKTSLCMTLCRYPSMAIPIQKEKRRVLHEFAGNTSPRMTRIAGFGSAVLHLEGIAWTRHLRSDHVRYQCPPRRMTNSRG